MPHIPTMCSKENKSILCLNQNGDLLQELNADFGQDTQQYTSLLLTPARATGQVDVGFFDAAIPGLRKIRLMIAHDHTYPQYMSFSFLECPAIELYISMQIQSSYEGWKWHLKK